MNEKVLRQYEELKRNRPIINAIEPDFLFEIVDYLLKENEELKENKTGLEEEIQEQAENLIQNEEYITKECILKEKVKDKIEKEIKYHERNILEIENITMLKSKTAKEEAEIEFNKYAIVVLKKILQKLIEERSDANENM